MRASEALFSTGCVVKDAMPENHIYDLEFPYIHLHDGFVAPVFVLRWWKSLHAPSSAPSNAVSPQGTTLVILVTSSR